ncbi:DNA alkylation repair protein [Leptospira sp. 96542]|nr:DNA alkylation repair protein [Leptospira sp. 96542]
MEPLKEMYSKQWVVEFGNILHSLDQTIEPAQFQKKILNGYWKQYELKERINHISDVLLEFWAGSPDFVFPKVLGLIDLLRNKGVKNFNFLYTFLNDIVSKIGLKHFTISMQALEKTTVFSSAEFAIRFFYLEDFDATVKQMKKWSKHKEAFVRRLASEGSRPHLPWGIGIPKIKQNPEIHLEILETLWDDPDEIVRRSVANHLNDISKLNPRLTIEFCKTKLGKSAELDKSIKHALRTLLKKGDTEVLSLFAYDPKWKPDKISFKLQNKEVKVGERIQFVINIKHSDKKEKKVRLEYKILYCLANGKNGKKVFQLGEKILKTNEKLEIQKSHSFAPITTRKYYPGAHEIIFVINGEEVAKQKFVLKM